MSADTPDFDPDACGYAVFGTQGGGYVRWDDSLQDYVFVEPPEDTPELRVGDRLPEKWDLIPANSQARHEGDDLGDFADLAEMDIAGLPGY